VELTELVENYVSSLRTTMWFDWDISCPDRRELAVRTMANTIAKIIGQATEPVMIGNHRLTPPRSRKRR